MHFCNDELQALLAAYQSLPFLGSIIAWVRGKLKKHAKPHCCNEGHAMFKETKP